MILELTGFMATKSPQKKPPGAEIPAATRRILIVDDEPAILFAYRKLLERENIAVDTSKSLAEALEMIGTYPYSAVVADMRLAGTCNTDGLQILLSIQEKQSGTRVILVTGNGTEQIKQKALDLGAAFYFEKPVAPTAILAALKALSTSTIPFCMAVFAALFIMLTSQLAFAGSCGTIEFPDHIEATCTGVPAPSAPLAPEQVTTRTTPDAVSPNAYSGGSAEVTGAKAPVPAPSSPQFAADPFGGTQQQLESGGHKNRRQDPESMNNAKRSRNELIMGVKP